MIPVQARFRILFILLMLIATADFPFLIGVTGPMVFFSGRKMIRLCRRRTRARARMRERDAMRLYARRCMR